VLVCTHVASDLCGCIQSADNEMNHVVDMCLLTTFEGGLTRLYGADDDATNWLHNMVTTALGEINEIPHSLKMSVVTVNITISELNTPINYTMSQKTQHPCNNFDYCQPAFTIFGTYAVCTTHPVTFNNALD